MAKKTSDDLNPAALAALLRRHKVATLAELVLKLGAEGKPKAPAKPRSPRGATTKKRG